MNVVMDDAAEVYLKDAKPRRELGVFSICLLCTMLTLLFGRTPASEGRQHHFDPAPSMRPEPDGLLL